MTILDWLRSIILFIVVHKKMYFTRWKESLSFVSVRFFLCNRDSQFSDIIVNIIPRYISRTTIAINAYVCLNGCTAEFNGITSGTARQPHGLLFGHRHLYLCQTANTVGVVQIEAYNMIFEQRKWQSYVIICRYDLRAYH